MTNRILAKNNILVAGVDAPVFKSVNNLRFAFLGYNDIGYTPGGVSGTDLQKMISDIRSARSQADVVIVEMHWGNEYQAVPSERQKEIGHSLIDAGADIIIGNHPHWIQPIEVYNGKIIVYSHGNFVFDQMWSEKTREGIVTRYTFYNKKSIDVEVIPVKIDDFGQPRVLEGDEKEKILYDIRTAQF
jgi:poly-gamma-glutamate synthesis protein (capsule biosynthesis protein)